MGFMPKMPRVSLTLFGRSFFLIVAELLVNALCWIVAGVLFSTTAAAQSMFSLALLSWASIANCEAAGFKFI
jgi:nickel/cobalt transporter (NiCoT) family protein